MHEGRKPAYLSDPDYRNGESAEIIAFGYYLFRGTSQLCLETKFSDGEERLAPLGWFLVSQDQTDYLSCFISDSNAPPIPWREARLSLGLDEIDKKENSQ